MVLDLVLLLLLLLPEYLSHIHSVKNPGDLNKYLCDPDHPLLTDTQLLLSPNINHILSSTSFCLVSNISNITLRSTSITPAIITCRHYNNSYESVGFGFYNVSGLMIENVHITKCGGPMPSISTLYPNDTTFYFHESQSVTLLVSYSSYITMLGVNINNYYGFAILLINVNKIVTLNNVNISSTSVTAQCSKKVVPSCGGSGLILYFSNLDNRIGLLEAHVLVNKTVIEGNWNIVPYTDINIASQVDAKEPKAISAFAAGMTIIFSLGNYSANYCYHMVISQSWLGVVDNGTTIGYTEHCPPGYCLPNTTINITQPDIMCRGNRMGWLCGQCKEGYSMVLGSTDCYQCSKTLHSVLAISFGILGGIVYVLVLFSLRLTIDLGTLGGFIFWLNIIWPYAIPSSEVDIKKSRLQYMVYLLTSIKYQWNIPVCITSDLNELEKTALFCFFPIYFWLIVAVIIFLSRSSTRITNLIVGSSIQVLATLMYISYSDLLSISLLVLTPSYIHFNSTNSSGELLVWFSDGSVLYGQNPFHIVLLCVSIVALSFFIVPFTLVGLFGVKMLRSHFIAKYFRPFIDAIHGPYKENLRYWFGLRLIVISLVYIVNAVLQGSNMTLQLVLSLIILVSFTLAEAVFLPFKSRILNALDLWFMVLLLVNFITHLTYSSSENTIITITTIIIVLSFVTFFVILLYHSYISMSQFYCIRKCVRYLFMNDNCKRIKRIFRKSSARSQENLMPLLRDDDSFQYEEW